MNKNYSFYALLLAIPFLGFLFFGYSSGQTDQYSGSPGDGGNTCVVCHTGSANFNATPSITTDIPATGYVYGETYEITVSVTSTAPGTPQRHGFQITAENSSNAKVGTFTAGMGSQAANSSHLLTHTYAGNSQTSWTFQWTAPADSEGEITFYVAVNATNKDNNLTGDQIVTTTLTTSHSNLSISEKQEIDFSVYPNPTTHFVSMKGSTELLQNAELSIFNNLGQIVSKKKLNSSLNKIDVTNLDKGVYFIKIKSGDKVGIRKFVKE